MKNTYWQGLYIEIDLRNSSIQKHTLCELLFFIFKIRPRMEFSLNIQTIATVTFMLYNSSTKKGNIKWTFYILNVAYILNTISSIIVCYSLFYNEILFPTKSTTELVCVSEQQRCFVSEGICSFERFGESVINNPLITTAICFVTEWMNDVMPRSLRQWLTATYWRF